MEETGHAFIGEYYQRMNIRDEQESCPCGSALQTRTHIISTCPRYTQFRSSIVEFIGTGNLKDLLGTGDGITIFLARSRAFTKDGTPPDTERPDPP